MQSNITVFYKFNIENRIKTPDSEYYVADLQAS